MKQVHMISTGKRERDLLQDQGAIANTPGRWRRIARLLHVLSRTEMLRGVSRRAAPSWGLWIDTHRYLTSFILVVILPSIAAILYLSLIASDQYVAQAKVAVLTVQAGPSPIKIDQTGGVTLPAQEPFIVASYIRSARIVSDISSTIDLRAIFTRQEADYLARLNARASRETLSDYWNSMVGVYVDGPSGIVTISARAFRPDDALRLGQAIVAASEKLINEISVRAREDAMRSSEQEVRRYEGQVRAALLELRTFRDKEGIIDPGSAASSTSKLLFQVMSEKIRLQSEIFVASRSMSNDAPTVQTMRMQAESLDQQIETLKGQLTGAAKEGRTVSHVLVTFEQLELQRIFSEKLYTSAQDAMERARVRVEQQQLYLSAFVPPSLPQDAEYPQRLIFSFIVPLSLVVLWGILALIAAAVEDHRL